MWEFCVVVTMFLILVRNLALQPPAPQFCHLQASTQTTFSPRESLSQKLCLTETLVQIT